MIVNYLEDAFTGFVVEKSEFASEWEEVGAAEVGDAGNGEEAGTGGSEGFHDGIDFG